MKTKVTNVSTDIRRFEHSGIWYYLRPKQSVTVDGDVSKEIKNKAAFKFKEETKGDE